MNFVAALAYLFCLALPEAFMQPNRAHLLAKSCPQIFWILLPQIVYKFTQFLLTMPRSNVLFWATPTPLHHLWKLTLRKASTFEVLETAGGIPGDTKLVGARES